MSDRLEELRRQRAQQRDHLAWLDREIAALEGAAPPESASPPPLTPGVPVDDRDVESILSEFRRAPVSIERRTKLGCIVYFVMVVGILAVAVLALYLHERAARGH